MRMIRSTLAIAAVVAVCTGCPPPDGGAPPTTPPTGTDPPPPRNTTFLAGKPPAGQNYNGSASRVQISGDGNWVVYHHGSENLVMNNRPPGSCPRVPNTNTQIYRTNLVSGATELVSIGTDGCFANGESSFPDVSSNGQYVVYMSKGTNLAPDGNGPQQDIFVKDMHTGATTIINKAPNGGAASGGSSSRPDLNDSGSLVAYSSTATNLVPRRQQRPRGLLRRQPQRFQHPPGQPRRQQPAA